MKTLPSKNLLLVIFVICLLVVIALVIFLGHVPRQDIEQSSQVSSSILYFAYGSNLSSNNMYSRCGSNITALGPAKLPNYEFTFDRRGSANIVPHTGQYVWGLLWNINSDCLRALDRYEGYPTLYGRQTVTVEWENNEVSALVYIESSKEAGGQPNYSYLKDKVIPGAKEHNLPPEWINKLENYLLYK